MQKLLLGLLSLTAIGLGVYLGAQPQTGPAKVRIRLVDAGTGKGVVGMVRVLTADKKHVELAGLYDRMTGLVKDNPGVHWYLVPAGGAEVALPRVMLRFEAVCGVESHSVGMNVDLGGKTPDAITLEMPMLFHADKLGLVAGNTHLHLKNMSLEQSDAYLRNIPAADGLRVMFISYLERDKDDRSYITNKYPIGDLAKLNATGVVFNNGEEHRHNFKDYGEGYGHVMFLGIKDLVKPVSIGRGIMNAGFDDPALRPGIDNAKKQGGTIIWCHNTNGYEDVPSAISGRLDAINVFDGSRTGKFEDNYYRYLNIGLRMPISTGTDWFMYDWSRVYAELLPSSNEGKPKLTIASWLDAVKAGRCQATNGPLLSLSVDGKTLGDVIDLKEPKTVKITASAIGRHPPQRLQLIRNGKVIKTQLAAEKNSTRIDLTHQVRVDEPAWFAVRIESDAKNEFGRTIYAHTSPIYADFQGKRVFDVDSAVALLKQVEDGRAIIADQARFSSPAAGKTLLQIYDDAAQTLRERVNNRK
ncbi:MAG: hypothetical protein FJ303_16060 [Planctomycetes bacterium]|nr:hypothetical protein [Planctomycetota bacterium]